MNIEEGGISMSAPSFGPSIGPVISGPSFSPSIGPSLGGFAVPTMEIGPIMSGPAFSMVNEGPAPMGSFDNFSPLMPSTPDLGGTFGPVDVLNSTFPIFEPQPMVSIFNEGPAPTSFLENSRPLVPADFSYVPKSMEIIANPFRPMYSDPGLLSRSMIEVAPRTSVFEPRTIEFVRPKIVEFIMPEIGVALPLTMPEEDEETESELEKVRKAINILKNDLETTSRSLEDELVAPQLKLQSETQKKVLKFVEKEERRNTTNENKKGPEVSKKRMIKDEKALAHRLHDAVIAVKMAFENATRMGKKFVQGREVRQHIPSEYRGVRSGVLEQDKKDDLPDGSYVFEEMEIEQIEETFSEEDMQSRVKQTVNKNIPVVRSENQVGVPVTNHDVEKVYLFRKSPPIEQIVESKQKAAN